MKLKKLLAVGICGMVLTGSIGLNWELSACTGFGLKTKDGTSVFGRSLEYALQLNSHITLIPKGMKLTGAAPGNKPGLKWQTKYNVMGLNMFGMDRVTDGINEKGLYSGIFMFPGFAGFQKVSPAEYSKTLGSWELTTWILTKFGSVEEVRKAISGVKVGEAIFKPQKEVFPAHYIILDASGDCIVIEYVKGKLHVYDNPVRMITNSPTFDWHLTNLRNYVQLTPENPKAEVISGYKIEPIGQGAGLQGLPGDFYPPSRFIKGVWLGHTALKVDSAEDGVRQAWQLLNTFYIVKGNIRSRSGEHDDYTQWQTVSDLKKMRYFVATYNSPKLRMYSFKNAPFQSGKIVKVPLRDKEAFYDDATGDFSGK